MSKKQTAVDWLIEKLTEYENAIKPASMLSYHEERNKIFAQARQMMREQIEESWNSGWETGIEDYIIQESGSDKSGLTFSDYFEQNYGE